MYIGKKSLVLIFLAFVTLASSYSQKKRRKQGFDIFEGSKIAPMAGLNAFYGDLVDESRASYTFGVAFEREMNTYLNARLNVNYGKMKGTQILTDLNVIPPSTYTKASFTNSYIDAGLGATFKPLDLALGYFRQRSFNPYIIGQIGINYFNATENYLLTDPSNPDYLIREESGIVPNISLGGGLSYWISPMLSVRLEVMANKPFSDLLDAHADWLANGVVYPTEAGDFYYTAMGGVALTIKDSRWKNQPKYNRKAYLKTKKYSIFQPKNRKKYKPKKRR